MNRSILTNMVEEGGMLQLSRERREGHFGARKSEIGQECIVPLESPKIENRVQSRMCVKR